MRKTANTAKPIFVDAWLFVSKEKGRREERNGKLKLLKQKIKIKEKTTLKKG